MFLTSQGQGLCVFPVEATRPPGERERWELVGGQAGTGQPGAQPGTAAPGPGGLQQGSGFYPEISRSPVRLWGGPRPARCPAGTRPLQLLLSGP